MVPKCFILAAVVMLVVYCAASPLSSVKALNRKQTAGLPLSPPESLEVLTSRMRRSGLVPEEQREVMSRQLLQALSDIIQREDCLSDYQGWVDFGRRSTN
ncbi:hypothetical protein DNTS_002900 [Danionella cerebrum]|uniref:Gastrin/cholecystokinin peptide hormone domain-containing protein n=1 Tax=Danionella cerebrum TaxID=2873325 RepID=A0A553QL37_9TELE|nr:hypothetical protein DNTS_002900 [Danionella translucida]